MGEKIIEIEALDPVDFYGVNDANLDIIRKSFPKLKIIARGNVVKAIGDENELSLFDDKFTFLIMHYEKFGKLTSRDILQLLENDDIENEKVFSDGSNVLVHGRNGQLIKARTVNQIRMVDSCKDNDMIFAIGPAGTGKTYTAVALAVQALKEKRVKRIILTRPAVEAGENLGFLPGDLRDKLDPYLQPLYDALRDMLPHQKLLSLFEEGTIEIAPLAFMRGRTLDNAFVILDEAQNATEGQLKMFLTRMGRSARFIITGDITQIDLPRNQRSGLLQASKILNKINGIDFIFLDERDVIRHKLVTRILNAYNNIDNININNKEDE